MESIATTAVFTKRGLSVCLLVATVSHAKTAEPDEMPNETSICVRPRNYALDGVPDPHGKIQLSDDMFWPVMYSGAAVWMWRIPEYLQSSAAGACSGRIHSPPRGVATQPVREVLDASR